MSPPPRIHCRRYYGVLAPNAVLRPAVTAPASQQAVAELATPVSEVPGATSRQSPPGEQPRRLAVYLWAMLLARIFELFPLVCPRCGGEVEIIAFITEAPAVRAILTHLGEPDRTARLPLPWPPVWVMFDQSGRIRSGPSRTGVRIRSKRGLVIQSPRQPGPKLSSVGDRRPCAVIGADHRIDLPVFAKPTIFQSWSPCSSEFWRVRDPFAVSARLDDRLYRSKARVGSLILISYPLTKRGMC